MHNSVKGQKSASITTLPGRPNGLVIVFLSLVDSFSSNMHIIFRNYEVIITVGRYGEYPIFKINGILTLI